MVIKEIHMPDQLLEEPRLLLGEGARDNITLTRLDDALRERPDSIVHAIHSLGEISLTDYEVPEGKPDQVDVDLLQTAIEDSAVRRVPFDDATEDTLDANEGLQALIAQMREYRGIAIGKKTGTVEENPHAVEARNSIWYTRIASLALRRIDWQEQNAAEREESHLPMAS
jgi:hypothetical protein